MPEGFVELLHDGGPIVVALGLIFMMTLALWRLVGAPLMRSAVEISGHVQKTAALHESAAKHSEQAAENNRQAAEIQARTSATLETMTRELLQGIGVSRRRAR